MAIVLSHDVVVENILRGVGEMRRVIMGFPDPITLIVIGSLALMAIEGFFYAMRLIRRENDRLRAIKELSTT